MQAVKMMLMAFYRLVVFLPVGVICVIIAMGGNGSDDASERFGRWALRL